VVNADITFSNPKIGTTVSLFYNVFGERISEVSAVSPNVYEQPVHSLDFSISQKLWDQVTLKLAAKNLLDPTYKKTIDFAGEELIYSSYRKGRTFSLSLSYEF
jgi:outer membrane receptor for ferrienterochelin and colicin